MRLRRLEKPPTTVPGEHASTAPRKAANHSPRRTGAYGAVLAQNSAVHIEHRQDDGHYHECDHKTDAEGESGLKHRGEFAGGFVTFFLVHVCHLLEGVGEHTGLFTDLHHGDEKWLVDAQRVQSGVERCAQGYIVQGFIGTLADVSILDNGGTYADGLNYLNTGLQQSRTDTAETGSIAYHDQTAVYRNLQHQLSHLAGESLVGL